LLPWPSFVDSAAIRAHLHNDIYLGHGIFLATAVIRCCGRCRRYDDTLLLWPSRLYAGRFMAQMTADGQDGTVDCRRHGAHFGHAVA
jgi:hypothetical protein